MPPKLDTPESLLQMAIDAEEQAKLERDPRCIGRCLADRDFYLKAAAELEEHEHAQG